ncbi:hypothetical protein BCR34DRAFT_676886 [Clohesyomyces aquaticus]|uniref:Uncharacterized protein n=1 Tax=Clohesyomyces aquaticus TaxID=1231657 RepID=A0A1Y1YMT1_9PLEO|nr:hypothetical protein BCR34DRAFT_676886 [Clohesyomyces aquaticus]
MYLPHFLLPLLILQAKTACAAIDETHFSSDNIIERDVAILGGGASGTYAAVRLSQDLNTSIIVIEPKDRLGGHVDTYVIPSSNATVEYGVQSYMKYGNAAAFFARLGVDIAAPNRRRLTNVNVDIETGAVLGGYNPPASTASTEAMKRWLTLAEKYESILEPGYWNFPAGNAIPAELLLPFGDFARDNNITDMAPLAMAISNVGIGGLKEVLTIDVMQAFGAPIVREFLAGTMFVPVGSNSLLYQRAHDLLRNDVLLRSRVIQTERDGSGVRLVVKSGDVTNRLIKAKRFLVTAPPSITNLKPLSLDPKEKAVFTTWTPTWSFVGLMTIPCIPENYSVSYIARGSAPADHLALRNYPYTLRFDSTGPLGQGLFRVLFATNYTISNEEAKGTIVENVHKLAAAGTLNATNSCKADFLAFSDHNSVLRRVSVETLREGWIQKLYGLQGHRATWYTGTLFGSDYTSNVWALTDTVLPRILKDLQ